MKLMVLDGNSIINRAFYGIRDLTTREGLHTNAVYGFVTTLQRLTAEETPDALCVAFDRREPTFRHRADADYKATRRGMPEELAQQLPVLKQVLDAMNIPRYELAGYEADDLIGTISRRCEAAGWECVIVTGDKDSLQLITDRTRVKLVATRMGQTTTTDMTPETFRAQYGFEPIHMIDLKALMGDSSDNIPGVPGIGEKTATDIIARLGSIDALYADPQGAGLKPAALRKLIAGEESARRSYWLATIVTDAPLDFDPSENLRKPPSDALYDLFLRLEFQKLIDKFRLRPGAEAAQRPVRTAPAEEVCTARRARELLALWRAAPQVALYAAGDLNAVSVAWEEGGETHLANLLSLSYTGDWRALLCALFAADIPKTAHGVKDLTGLLWANDLPAEGFTFDTALAGYLLDATAGSYDLERLFVSYCGAELPPDAHSAPDAFSLLGDAAAAATSLASRCSAVFTLRQRMEPLLEEKNLRWLLDTVEMPLCPVLADMERTGMRCDGAALEDFSAWLQEELTALEQRIYAQAGTTFNINSPRQLGTVLFEGMGLPHGKKTKTGWSTGAEVLEKLRCEAPIVEDILTYRQYSKLKSTYADGLLKAMGPDGRIHTHFRMTSTDSGRLSSTEPNLQNIPTRTELGSQIRRLFTAGPGHVLVDADYSQVELRILAHMAHDEAMIAAFRSGKDFHAATAAKVYGVAEADVTPAMRRSAKAVNFGIVYGISAFSLARDIGVSVAEAREFMERYFAAYPGVKQYMHDVVAKARENGFVETLWHRRRPLPEITSSNFNLRAFGERVALNMPIQGTAADVMKLAMVRVWQRLSRELPEAKLIMQVHDELLAECPAELAPAVQGLLTEEMEQVIDLSVPLVAEAHCGKNWVDAK